MPFFCGVLFRAPAMIGLFTSLDPIASEQHSSSALPSKLAQLQRSAKLNVVLKQHEGRGTVRGGVEVGRSLRVSLPQQSQESEDS